MPISLFTTTRITPLTTPRENDKNDGKLGTSFEYVQKCEGDKNIIFHLLRLQSLKGNIYYKNVDSFIHFKNKRIYSLTSFYIPNILRFFFCTCKFPYLKMEKKNSNCFNFLFYNSAIFKTCRRDK